MSWKLRTSLLALIAAAPGIAGAADLPLRAPPPPVPLFYSWAGWYAGSQAGYSFDNIKESSFDGIPGYATGIGGVIPAGPVLANGVNDRQTFSPRGGFTGIHVGYNRQMGSFVYGLEGDLNWDGARQDRMFGQNSLALALGTPYGTNIQENFNIGVRGRVGYAADRTLFYLAGGLAVGQFTTTQNYWSASTIITPSTDIFSQERFGWTLGAGIEYAFADHWSARVEYRHNEFASRNVYATTIPGLTFRDKLSQDQVSIGVSYHFGTIGGPVETAALLPPKGPKGPIKAVAPPPPPVVADSFFGRFVNAYKDEWGQGASTDPVDPTTRRPYFPPAPVQQPPYPFTDYSYGGANGPGVSAPNQVDSPFMKALHTTPVGTFLEDSHIQVYGWINPGINISTAHSMPGSLSGGNAPAVYSYQPNKFQLDQVVAIIERVPDTVQKDHWDWGFRISPLYGETYRYTTAFGLASTQLQKWNKFAGYDSPMIYGELYIPGVMEGLLIRAGRYISVPDIEAQLAPNNYMYSHSMTYGYDNYTNTGIIGSLQVTKNFMVQTGITVGTDSTLFQNSRSVVYPAVPAGQLYQPVPGVFASTGNGQVAYVGHVDPGLRPSFTGCLKYQTDDSYNNIYGCANALNKGDFGYNNLQQYALTFYHKFNEEWHISMEAWFMHENNVPNASSPFVGAVPNPFAYMVNGPNLAQCLGNLNPSCTAKEYSTLIYLNYKFSPLDNISWRAEYFNDLDGQRTGTRTSYFNYAMGYQHWFSPTIEFRPEVAMYNSLKAPAFQVNAPLLQSAPNNIGTKSHIAIVSADVIIHF